MSAGRKCTDPLKALEFSEFRRIGSIRIDGMALAIEVNARQRISLRKTSERSPKLKRSPTLHLEAFK